VRIVCLHAHCPPRLPEFEDRRLILGLGNPFPESIESQNGKANVEGRRRFRLHLTLLADAERVIRRSSASVQNAHVAPHLADGQRGKRVVSQFDGTQLGPATTILAQNRNECRRVAAPFPLRVGATRASAAAAEFRTMLRWFPMLPHADGLGEEPNGVLLSRADVQDARR
jgi:hypothetical protein